MDFAFFAVRVRVVQIDDSPFAPVFEVVEKPNTWGRALEKRVNEAEGKLTRLRRTSGTATWIVIREHSNPHGHPTFGSQCFATSP